MPRYVITFTVGEKKNTSLRAFNKLIARITYMRDLQYPPTKKGKKNA